MFTGLVEGSGGLKRVVEENGGRRLTIHWPDSCCSEPLKPGESIAVSGCCLTVAAVADSQFDVQAGPETLARTNLGDKKPGDRVNLERALKVGDRLGGHFVQGHIDTTALLRPAAGKASGNSSPSVSTRSGPPSWCPKARSPSTA